MASQPRRRDVAAGRDPAGWATGIAIRQPDAHTIAAACERQPLGRDPVGAGPTSPRFPPPRPAVRPCRVQGGSRVTVANSPASRRSRLAAIRQVLASRLCPQRDWPACERRPLGRDPADAATGIATTPFPTPWPAVRPRRVRGRKAPGLSGAADAYPPSADLLIRAGCGAAKKRSGRRSFAIRPSQRPDPNAAARRGRARGQS